MIIFYHVYVNNPGKQSQMIFQCSKNYGSPVQVTRFKVAPNIEDPISLNENRL